jgi:hypothetical protein
MLGRSVPGPWTEHDHFVGDQFGAKVFLAVGLIPATRAKFTFNVYTPALGQVSVADFCQTAPGYDVKPFG